MINNKGQKILWEQTIESGIDWSGKALELIICGCTGMWLFYEFHSILTSIGQTHNVWFWSILKIGCLAGAGLYLLVSQIFVGATLKYQIREEALIFNWGIKQSITVEIPFSDFRSINLVEYNNSDESTIYLVTKNDYPTLHKGSFDNDDPRHTYTLEKIKNGPAVYELLMKKWNAARPSS